MGEASSDYGPLPSGRALWRLSADPAELRNVADGRLADPSSIAVRELQDACCKRNGCERKVASFEFVFSDGTERWVVAAFTDAAPLRAFDSHVRATLGLANEDTDPAAASPEPAAELVVAPPVSPPSATLSGSPLMLRREGLHWVLRDFESEGPRSAFVSKIIGAGVWAALALAAAAWARNLHHAGASAAHWGGACGLAVLFALTSFAFFSVARFARTYSSLTKPLLWMAEDKLVVAPWFDREGRIETLPEGHFGAAVPLSEVDAFRVEQRNVIVETAHGPMLVVTARSPEEAAGWADRLGTLARRLVHPGARPSMKQRHLAAQSVTAPP